MLRIRLGLLCAAVLLVTAATVVLLPARASARSRGPKLVVSGKPGTRNAVPLAGHTLAGKVYVAVASARGARSVTFRLDRRAAGRHQAANRALTLVTSSLRDGNHMLRAVLHFAGRRQSVVTARFRVHNQAPAPALIQTALALHEIDYGTSLLDRLYAVWGDARLPTAFRGTGAGKSLASTEEVLMLAAEAVHGRQVPAAEAAALRPFIVRPTEPGSAFAAAFGATRDAVRGHAAACVGPPGWVTDFDGGVRAWVPSTHPNAVGLATKIAQEGATALQAEKPDMDIPVPDAGSDAGCSLGNPDSSIDIYVVSPKDYYASPRHPTPIADWDPADESPAATLPASPNNGTSCSGFVSLDESQVESDDQRQSILVHELYHVLQNKYACDADTWFTEASATWAMVHYLRSSQYSKGYVQTAYDLFQLEQPRSLETYCKECDPAYDNWLWPLFMSQEGVDPSQVWKALGGAKTALAALRVINSKVPFAQFLQAFALRDLSIPYHEQDGTPGPTFGDPPNGVTLADESPSGQASQRLGATHGKQKRTSIRIPANLQARYLTLNMPSSEPYVEVDLSGVGGDVDVDALVQRAGQSEWEHRPLPGKKLKYCRDNFKDDISKVLVVLSNHSLDPVGSTSSNFSYKTSSQCPFQVSGNLNFQASGNGHQHVDDGDCSSADTTSSASFSGHANIAYAFKADGEEQSNTSNTVLTGTEQVQSSGVAGHNDSGTGCLPFSTSAVGQYSGALSGDKAITVQLGQDGDTGKRAALIGVIMHASGAETVQSQPPRSYAQCNDGTSPGFALWETEFVVDLSDSGSGTLNLNQVDNQADQNGEPFDTGGCINYGFDTARTAITGTITVSAPKTG